MRNLKRALSLAVASVMLLGMMVVGTGAAYSDVTAEHNEEAIAVVTAAGIMGGTGEGFAPDKKVTRNEMAVIISNLMEYDIDEYAGAAAAFTDVPAWASKYVDAAYANGIVAGKSATTYGGEDTITNAEAGLMLMKVLGYFQFAADFGTDWKLAVITKGDEIDLYVGVDGSADTAMTRDNVAQLVLNVLESTLVSGKQTGTSANITAGDVKVEITGEVTYTAKVDKDEYDYNEVDDKDEAEDLYLIEKLHGGDIVKKEGDDKYGRPGYGWYDEGEEIVFIADKALATYAGADFDLDELEDDFDPDDWTGFDADVYYNGSEYTGRQGLAWFYGANGAVIEVYGDKDDEEIERFVAIEAYLATIAEDAIETDDDDEVTKVTITVFEHAYIEDGGKEIVVDLDDEDHEDAYELIKGYEEEDFFMVYMAQDWDVDGAEALLDVADVETVEGEVTALKDATKIVDSWVEIDDKKYELANEFVGEEYIVEDEGVFYLFNDYIYMFDKDGNAADPDQFYAWVLDEGSEPGRYGDETKYFAKIVTTEGKVEEIEITEDSELSDVIVYEYDEDEKAYVTAPAGEDDTDVELIKGKTAISDIASANSKTVYVYIEYDYDEEADVYEFDEVSGVYTGYKAIKSVEAEYVVAVFEEGEAAEYVFVVNGASVSSDSDDLIIVLGDDSDSITSKKLGTYYEYNAIVAGEKTTIKTVDEIDETVIFKSAKVDENNVYDFADNGDDDAVEGTDYFEAESDEFGKAADDVITVGGVAMAYEEDAKVFVIDEKDDSIAKGSLTKNYKTDVKAVLYTLNDDDEVSALYIIKDTSDPV